ncbi:DNA mismatch repair protein MutS [Peptoniphilus sp. GNH]|nr:DNA mismatch repair protein MutS [Peptoniphilus sp. GNH]
MNNVDFENLTPMLKQYLETKNEYKGAILFFRLGDFYEMFFDDALLASKELDLTLTQRAAGGMNKAPMCGVPYHVANQYISRLVEKGYKVAICDQLEDPKEAEGIVKRGVTRVVTPGTFTDTDFLEKAKNNYLLSIFAKENYMSLAYVDYTTGELFYREDSFLDKNMLTSDILSTLAKLEPSEFIVNEEFADKLKSIGHGNFNLYLSNETVDWFKIKDFLNSDFLEDVRSKRLEKSLSLYQLLIYLFKTQKRGLNHINRINMVNKKAVMGIDESAIRNLEIFESLASGKRKGSLLDSIDFCNNSMGKRALRRFLEEPLQEKAAIEERLDFVEILVHDPLYKDRLRAILKDIYDIERLSTKISEKSLNPRDLINLKQSLLLTEDIRSLLNERQDACIKKLRNYVNLEEIKNLIDRAIVDEPSLNTEERFIKRGYDPEFDEIYEAATRGSDFIIELEEREKQKTGIPKLRVRYNKILGYFIEVTKSYLDQIPNDYIRKQTLVGSERYFTLELKSMESKILAAKGQVLEKQKEILDFIGSRVLEKLADIQDLARKIARLDALTSLGQLAFLRNYTRPKINSKNNLIIKDGRHPSVEVMMDEEFIPNDVIFSENSLIKIITGPNMAGKSTYMRMCAIITIMAHIGSFVPASRADICIVDKIFTRIGASDNLGKGESTFMVEMKEVAKITREATPKSLLILDEVGRGTSTSDGLAIAWALTEYIDKYLKCKTLFATHYHELADIEKKLSFVENLHLSVKEIDGKLVFLRKILKGSSDNSYGIEVADLAGVSKILTSRAYEILEQIDNKDVKIQTKQKNFKQESIFEKERLDFIDNIRKINIDDLTPLMGLNLLSKLKEVADKL